MILSDLPEPKKGSGRAVTSVDCSVWNLLEREGEAGGRTELTPAQLVSLFTLRPQGLDFGSFCRLFPDHSMESDETEALMAVQKGLITNFVVGMCCLWIKPTASCMPSLHSALELHIPAAFVATCLFQL